SHAGRQPVRLAGKIFNDIDLATIDEILADGLHEYIDRLQERLNTLGEAIFETHVLYADLTPLSTLAAASSRSSAPLGAWHADLDIQIQQQQQ
ncbi:MAG: alpha-E domain-containing protein, partial [Roseimicrobium sp.]